MLTSGGRILGMIVSRSGADGPEGREEEPANYTTSGV